MGNFKGSLWNSTQDSPCNEKFSFYRAVNRAGKDLRSLRFNSSYEFFFKWPPNTNGCDIGPTPDQLTLLSWWRTTIQINLCNIRTNRPGRYVIFNGTMGTLHEGQAFVCGYEHLCFDVNICHSIYCRILTHWDRVTHICVNKLTIIGSDDGLSTGRRQAIIWTNARILLIEPLGTNFSEILIEILTFSFKKMHLKCRLENGGHLVSASMC